MNRSTTANKPARTVAPLSDRIKGAHARLLALAKEIDAIADETILLDHDAGARRATDSLCQVRDTITDTIGTLMTSAMTTTMEVESGVLA